MIEIAAKRFDAGIVKLKEANAAIPAANVLYNISRAYRDGGDLPHALDYLRKYVVVNPGDDNAAKEIDEIERQMGAQNGKTAPPSPATAP